MIDGKAELERRKLMNAADLDCVQLLSKADADKMHQEGVALKENPLLIQKIIAEKLSDKVQIMMVPSDGKFFFANDLLKGAMPTAVAGGPEPLGGRISPVSMLVWLEIVSQSGNRTSICCSAVLTDSG